MSKYFQLEDFYGKFEKFHIVNEYGLHLKKMRAERFEIIYEHSQNVEGPWTEYRFMYKPSIKNNTLPIYTGIIHFFTLFLQHFVTNILSRV